MNLFINRSRRTLLICAAAIILIGATHGFAQQPEIQSVGAYAKTATTDKEVGAAANFAVKAQAKKQKAKIKLVSINNAARQVVAGMNYQVCLNVETLERKAKTAVPQIVQAIIYQDLKGRLSLTSWTVAACTEAAPMLPTR